MISVFSGSRTNIPVTLNPHSDPSAIGKPLHWQIWIDINNDNVDGVTQARAFLEFYDPGSESIYRKLERVDFEAVKKTALLKFANDLSHTAH